MKIIFEMLGILVTYILAYWKREEIYLIMIEWRVYFTSYYHRHGY